MTGKERNKQIRTYIEDYYLSNHCAPTQTQIASALGISQVAVSRHMKEMSKDGMIKMSNHKVTGSPVINKFSAKYINVPVFSSIPYGDPEENVHLVDEYISLSTTIFGEEASYVLRINKPVKENSTLAPNILLVIHTQKTCEVGDGVVVLDDNGQNILAKFEGWDNSTNQAILSCPGQADCQTRQIRMDKLIVRGVVKRIIRSFESDEEPSDEA